MDKLTDARLKSYDKISRYSTIPYYYDVNDDKYIYGTSKPINRDTDYTTYMIRQGDTIDSIALEQYGDALFYWAIADFNKINDPFVKLRVGAYIRVPTLLSINFGEQ